MAARWIKDSLKDSDRWNACCAEARDLWLRLVLSADDYGLLDGRASVVFTRCYPLQTFAGNCLQSVARCSQLLEELERADLVRRYEAEGKGYLWLTAFHERPRASARFPQPEQALKDAPRRVVARSVCRCTLHADSCMQPAGDCSQPADSGTQPADKGTQSAADCMPSTNHGTRTTSTTTSTLRGATSPTSEASTANASTPLTAAACAADGSLSAAGDGSTLDGMAHSPAGDHALAAGPAQLRMQLRAQWPANLPIEACAAPYNAKAAKAATPAPTTARAWDAYAEAYAQRYGVRPVRNALVNTQLKRLVERLGDDAQAVAAFYLTHQDAFYVKKMHAVGMLLADAEKLRTEWLTRRQITGVEARQIERKSATAAAANALLAEMEAQSHA